MTQVSKYENNTAQAILLNDLIRVALKDLSS